MNSDAFYDRFSSVPLTQAPAPDTRPLADESMRSGVSPSRGDSGSLDPTADAWHAILVATHAFRQQIAKAESVAELVQLRERVTILSGELADLADTAGTLADAVIARRS